MRPGRTALCAALALAALTSGCGGGSGGSGGASATTPAADGLTGTHWTLDAQPGAGAVDSWIRFGADGKVTGNDGCNGFSGPYTRTGAKLTLGPLAGTQMACAGAADAVSRRVTAGLARVAAYAVARRALELKDAAGATVLGYHEERATIEGAWDVTSVLYDDAIRSVILDTKLTATFAADGRISGSTGCNTFRGPYTASGDRIEIGPLAATRRACTSPEGAQAQEQGYLAALESAVRIEQTASRLTLMNAKDQMAVTLERSG